MLTAIQIRSFKEPGRYSDGEGLILNLISPGRGSWMVRVQANGKRRDIGLGALADIGLGEAREAARKIRKDTRAGIDVLAERKKERIVVPTFQDAARQVHAEHKAAWKNGKHQAQWIATLETYVFPTLGDRLVAEIEGPAIRDVLSPIWLTKPETARRVRQRIGAVLDWAYAKGFRSSEAPMRSLARGLPRQPKKQGHFAALPVADIPAFLTSLRERVTVGRLALEFLILTAARSGEIRGCSWSEIDPKARLWTIPGERMTEQNLHGAKVAGCPVDQRSLRSTHRMRAVFRVVRAYCTDPFVDQSGVLAGAEVTHITDPAREDEIVQRATTAVEPCQQCFARFGHQFELNGSMGLLLDHRRSISNGTAGDDVADLHLDYIAAAQLAIDRQVEQRSVP